VNDEPQDPSAGVPAFEAPHSNGAVHEAKPGRAHAPWEFMVLTLFVAILCIGIVLGWTFIGSHSPERLDDASAAAVSAACDQAQAKLKVLADADPRGNGTQRAARVRAENAPLREMVTRMGSVHPRASTPANALRAWTADWGRMIDARTTYANALTALATSGDPNAKVRLIYPAVNAIKPVTDQMDDFVRENNPHLDACFTGALQIEVVEGPRDYKKVTS
jgi:hypothetical protein